MTKRRLPRRAEQAFVELQTLAELLALPEGKLRDLLCEPTATSLAWEEVFSRAAPEAFTALRAALRDARLKTPGSRWWLSGYPELVAQWHPTRNGDCFPDQYRFGSTKKVWWKCDAGPDHEWTASANQRTSGGIGCPFCTSRRVSVTNSLQTRAPEIAAQWHPTRNEGITPEQVIWSSARVIWWRCLVAPDHEWPARINNRTSGRAGCPFCNGASVASSNALAVRFPALALEWHSGKNGSLGPTEVKAGSPRRVWWRCTNNADHIWQAAVKTRAAGGGCPFCHGLRSSYRESLAARFRSLSTEWHPSLNGSLQPRDVRSVSSRRVFWKCQRDASHVWRAAIARRTQGRAGCPQCARLRRSV
jgi:hypothetical protein